MHKQYCALWSLPLLNVATADQKDAPPPPVTSGSRCQWSKGITPPPFGADVWFFIADVAYYLHLGHLNGVSYLLNAHVCTYHYHAFCDYLSTPSSPRHGNLGLTGCILIFLLYPHVSPTVRFAPWTFNAQRFAYRQFAPWSIRPPPLRWVCPI